VRHPRPAQLQLLCPSLHDLYGTLDACSVADYVLLFLSPSVEVDTVGETVLRSLCALGVPDNGVRAVVCGPSAPTSDVRKSLLSFSQHFFPSLARLYAASEPGEASNLVRSLCEAAPKGITWREDRGRVLVEEGEWRDGELRVTGVIRGAPMSADRLVHLPGIGDCQLDRVCLLFAT
jgi:pre-rRNA-processing protein TSR1